LTDHEPIGNDPDELLVIVTGSHLRGEIGDRPIAYGLRERMTEWLGECFGDRTPVRAVVCSDLWYMNNDSIRSRPTVSIGGPGVNALAAFLADKLPSVFTIDQELLVQMDLEGGDRMVSCWGINEEMTGRAVGIFVERYLDAFMREAVREFSV